MFASLASAACGRLAVHVAPAAAAARSMSTGVPMTATFPGTPSAQPVPTVNDAVQVTTLPNGLRVVSVDAATPVVAISVDVAAGSRYDHPRQPGSSFLLHRMAFKNNTFRTQLKQSRDLEALGGSFAVSASRDSLTVEGTALRGSTATLAQLALGALQPKLAEYEVRDELEVAPEVSEAALADPAQAVMEDLHAEAFRDQPLGQPLYGSREALAQLTPSSLKQFAGETVRPSRAAVAAVGVDHATLVAAVTEALSGPIKVTPPKGAKPAPAIGSEAAATAYVGGSARHAALGNTHLAIAYEGAALTSKDSPTFLVLQALLGCASGSAFVAPGAGVASRLGKVAADNAWLGVVQAFNVQHRDAGLFGVYAEAEPGHVEQLAQAIVRQFVQLADKPVDALELSRAQKLAKGSLLRLLEQRVAHASFLARQITAGRAKPLTPVDLATAVESVSAADVQRAAKAMLQKRPSVAARGDVHGLPLLEKLTGKA